MEITAEEKDRQLAMSINQYMAENRLCSRNQIRLALKTTVAHMDRLAKAGLVKLPGITSKKITATMTRKKHRTGAGFVINKFKFEA